MDGCQQEEGCEEFHHGVVYRFGDREKVAVDFKGSEAEVILYGLKR